MKNILVALIFVAGFAACTQKSNQPATTSEMAPKSTSSESNGGDQFKIINVKDLATMMEAKKPLFIFDANTDKTRHEKGMIPGAVALESASQYDADKVLPKDKKSPLVFYCHSTT